jgi:hypothetical protein
LPILSPRFTQKLTAGCETPSFFDISVALKPNPDKPEFRNSKYETNPKIQTPQTKS